MPEFLPSPLIPFARVVPPTAPSPAVSPPLAPQTEGSALGEDVASATEAPAPAVPTSEVSMSEEADAAAPVDAFASPRVGPELDAPPSAASSPGPVRRWGMALALILASAAIGFFLADRSAPPGALQIATQDLLLLVAERGVDVAPDRALADRAAAGAYARDATGLQVRPPRLAGYALTGAGAAALADAYAVPYFTLAPEDSPEVAVPVYALTYAHLDAAEGALTMPRPLVNRIAGGAVHVQPLAEALTALVWRERATIYVALTDQAPEPLADAIP